MELKQLIKFLKEKESKDLKDIEFEDYNGNTLFKLSDLNIADVENDTLRLQYEDKDTFQRVREGMFPMGNLSREDIEQAFEDGYDEDDEEGAKIIKAVRDNVDNISDEKMQRMAERMMEAYTGHDYWETLKNFVEEDFAKELKLKEDE